MLTDKRILLTGGNSGIGLAITKTFCNNNARIVSLYNKNRSGIDKLIEQNPNLKSSVDFYSINLLDETKLDDLLEKILKSDSFDGFIHCVTFPTNRRNLTDIKWIDIQSHINLQTKSFFEILQRILPSMKEKRYGKIISILTSYVIGAPPKGIMDYVVGKYSLLGLTKSLAVELGQYGINVNSISPFITNTPLTEKLPSKFKEITLSQVPLGRLCEPDDVATAALFLCSTNSNYISGENLVLSGGYTMK